MDFPVTDSSSSPVGNTDEFLIDLELDAVADSVAQAVADIATGKQPTFPGFIWTG